MYLRAGQHPRRNFCPGHFHHGSTHVWLTGWDTALCRIVWHRVATSSAIWVRHRAFTVSGRDISRCLHLACPAGAAAVHPPRRRRWGGTVGRHHSPDGALTCCTALSGACSPAEPLSWICFTSTGTAPVPYSCCLFVRGMDCTVHRCRATEARQPPLCSGMGFCQSLCWPQPWLFRRPAAPPSLLLRAGRRPLLLVSRPLCIRTLTRPRLHFVSILACLCQPEFSWTAGRVFSLALTHAQGPDAACLCRCLVGSICLFESTLHNVCVLLGALKFSGSRPAAVVTGLSRPSVTSPAMCVVTQDLGLTSWVSACRCWGRYQGFLGSPAWRFSGGACLAAHTCAQAFRPCDVSMTFPAPSGIWTDVLPSAATRWTDRSVTTLFAVAWSGDCGPRAVPLSFLHYLRHSRRRPLCLGLHVRSL